MTSHDLLPRWQFSLFNLLIVTSVVAVVLAMPSIAFFLLTLVGTACGIRFAWRHRLAGALESVVGAGIGGFAGVVITLIEAYTSNKPFEDSGLGFFGTLALATPLVVLIGTITGVVAWLAVVGCREVISRSCVSASPDTPTRVPPL
ncbi:MAG: hypothetical protein H8E66_04420 [Planctomycetes bacterium]|nr:hypothetical protein [Planctomycetota bacterium]